MVRGFLIILALFALSFSQQQPVINDIFIPGDVIVLHASDTAADGIDTIIRYGKRCTIRAIMPFPFNDSLTLQENPLYTPSTTPNLFVKVYAIKGEWSLPLLSGIIKWSGSGVDSCYAAVR